MGVPQTMLKPTATPAELNAPTEEQMCFPLSLDVAIPLIVSAYGYENTQHLALVHTPTAAWIAEDGQIIFYCGLKQRVFTI